MTKWTILLLAGTAVSSVQAGDIIGKISSSNAKATPKAVVWVEGVKKAPRPTNHPALSQKGVQFSPTFQVVVQGQTVDMPNDDSIAHNVFSYSPTKQFDLGIYAKGQSKSVSFDKTGLVDVFCSLHRHMNAKILVVPNVFYAETELGKDYKIVNVPAGTYTLKIWHQDKGIQERKVTVPAKGSVQKNIDNAKTP